MLRSASKSRFISPACSLMNPMKMNSGTAGRMSSFIEAQICRYARLNVGSRPRPIDPKTSAMYSSVKEIGTPTKMIPIMLASMISPRTSLPVTVGASAGPSDQDLLAMHQLLAGAGSPQRLQQLRDALREHQQGRERNDGAERPDDRTPQA